MYGILSWVAVSFWEHVNVSYRIVRYRAQVAYGSANNSSAVAEMDDRLATIDMDRKVGGDCCTPFWGAGSPSNTIWCGTRPTSVPSGISKCPPVWPQKTWAENWRAVPFYLGITGSPSNTVWSWLIPTSVPSGILIHPAIWPQQTGAEN